jgi:hypothetical protein
MPCDDGLAVAHGNGLAALAAWLCLVDAVKETALLGVSDLDFTAATVSSAQGHGRKRLFLMLPF